MPLVAIYDRRWLTLCYPRGLSLPRCHAHYDGVIPSDCFSTAQVSHAAMRNMMACTVSGQGAGTAAAVSLTQGTSTRHVDAGTH